MAIVERKGDIGEQVIIWSYRALTALLLVRATTLPHLVEQITEQDANPVATALVAAQRSLELADEYARRKYPDVWDYVQAYWLLGAAHRVNGNMEESDRHLTEAITRCRTINLVLFEVDILLELARLRLATGKRDEASKLADEALEITERCGYVLQGADVHLFLAQLALADDDRQKALFHAREARRLATCDVRVTQERYPYPSLREAAPTGILLRVASPIGEGCVTLA
ncbi:MAG: hypothetical protein V7K92_16235 [Nostoc sp.]|uniref:hypothetical protein n=1 Tax=Nostoc sp. TaxID=1180 RepID=UPI002FF33334